jgi:hypothetical protein
LLFGAAPIASAAGYAIETTGPFTFHFVSGDSVAVKIEAPSAALLKSAVVQLNGQPVKADASARTDK